jgi:hypothetical protein
VGVIVDGMDPAEDRARKLINFALKKVIYLSNQAYRPQH